MRPLFRFMKMEIKMEVKNITAVVLLFSGVVMSFMGFYAPPVGEISDSVLWYFAQTLIYCGSIFGVSAYIDSKLKTLKHEKN